MVVLVGLFGMFGYAGFRTAQRARDRYGKLLVAGLTALILVQTTVNLFAVMGLAPLTGVPLPFVSYGNSSLLVMLAAVGLMLNVAKGGRAPAPVRRRPQAQPKPKPRRKPPRAPRARPARGGARAEGARLRVLDGGLAAAVESQRRQMRGGNGRHSNGGNSRTRGPGAGGRRRAAR
jgi:cell division protein FtsW